MRNQALIAVIFLASRLPAQGQDAENHDKFYSTKLMLQVAPFVADMSPSNSAMGWGMELSGLVGKRVSFVGSFGKGKYFDASESGNDPIQSNSYQGIEPFLNNQLSVRFHFIDRVRDGRIQWEKVGTRYVGGDLYQTSEVHKSRGPVRKILAARGGIYNWRTSINPVTTDVWYLNSPAMGEVQATERDYTTLHSSNLTFGLSSGKLVDGPAFGRHISYMRSWYFDVMLNTSTKLDDLTSQSGSTSSYVVGKGSLHEKTLGWRIGWEYYALARKYITATFRMEGGQRPGLEERENFFQLTFSMGLKYDSKEWKR